MADHVLDHLLSIVYFRLRQVTIYIIYGVISPILALMRRITFQIICYRSYIFRCETDHDLGHLQCYQSYTCPYEAEHVLDIIL